MRRLWTFRACACASIALEHGNSHGENHLISIDTARMTPPDTHLLAALAAEDGSTRLKAALAIGSNPESGLVDTLVARCAIEPDFYVRDMLTWALTRFPSEITVPRLVAELRSESAQARSQALHTLSKIKDPGAFPAITRSLLRDPSAGFELAVHEAKRLFALGKDRKSRTVY